MSDLTVSAIFDAVGYNPAHFDSIFKESELNAYDNIQELFERTCKKGHFEVAKYIYENTADIELESDLFNICCDKGFLNIAQWLYSIKSDIYDKSDTYPFAFSCSNGHLDVAKWLYSIHPDIDIFDDEYDTVHFVIECEQIAIFDWLFSIKRNDIIESRKDICTLAARIGKTAILQHFYSVYPDITKIFRKIFIEACNRGKINVILWIYSIQPHFDISKYQTAAFNYVCENKYMDIVEWFHTRNPAKFQYIQNMDGTVTPNIQIVIEGSKEVDEIQTCSICLYSVSTIVTNCNHKYCMSCITEWCKKNTSCPYCRNDVQEKNLFYIKSE